MGKLTLDQYHWIDDMYIYICILSYICLYTRKAQIYFSADGGLILLVL